MSKVVKSYVMSVRFNVLEDGTLEVYTDGSFMGDFGTFGEAGKELGYEFRYRMYGAEEVKVNPG